MVFDETVKIFLRYLRFRASLRILVRVVNEAGYLEMFL